MAAMALALASCSSDDTPTTDNSIEHPISLASVSVASVSDFTRADAGTGSSSIESGSLGLSITANGDKTGTKYLCENAKFEYKDNGWSCANTYYWASDNATISYIAYWPYQDVEYSNLNWNVSDQNKDLDLCYVNGTATNSTDNHSIVIAMDHVCSKLIVNVTKFGDEIKEGSTISGIKISGINVGGTFKLDDGTWTNVTTTGDIAMNNTGDKTYEAILIPQTATVTLTVEVGDTEYIMALNNQEFAKGTQYTLNIQVGQDITKAGSITRTPWVPADGGTITVQ